MIYVVSQRVNRYCIVDSRNNGIYAGCMHSTSVLPLRRLRMCSLSYDPTVFLGDNGFHTSPRDFTRYHVPPSPLSRAALIPQPAAKPSQWVQVRANNAAALMTALAQQPVATFVEADQSTFQFYMSGVLTSACGSMLNHMLLATGYGTDAVAGDYWRAQNTWGASWGEAGYIRLGRGSNYPAVGQCGIQSQPVYPA